MISIQLFAIKNRHVPCVYMYSIATLYVSIDAEYVYMCMYIVRIYVCSLTVCMCELYGAYIHNMYVHNTRYVEKCIC